MHSVRGDKAVAYQGTLHALVTITQREGPRALFKGLGASLVGKPEECPL